MVQRCFARPRRRLRIASAAVLLVFGAGVGALQAGARNQSEQHAARGGSDATYYRIFLHDGDVLVSYGEFARTGDRVVITIPAGGTDSTPALHLLTIAEGDVDWARTDAYAEAARARRYAETRGEADFTRLTRDVADTLFRVGMVSDDAQRLALAEQARRQLLEWPLQHHGYRSEEIGKLTTMLDQVVSELRIAAGQASFDLTLVAGTPAPRRPVALLPPPNARERVESALLAARRSTDAAERVSLLRSVLDAPQPEGPDGSWMAAVRERATAELAAESRIDRAYASLTRRILESAAVYSGNASARGLESLVRLVLEEDRRLKQARPAEVAALLAALDARIDAARRLRLARHAWVRRLPIVRAYWEAVRQPLDRLLGLREWLTDVRRLAGPEPGSVRRLAEHAARASRELALIQPPAEAAGVHATLTAAAALASRAAAARLDAVSGGIDAAWQASSAAAGALMVLEQGVQELGRVTNPPVSGER